MASCVCAHLYLTQARTFGVSVHNNTRTCFPSYYLDLFLTHAFIYSLLSLSAMDRFFPSANPVYGIYYSKSPELLPLGYSLVLMGFLFIQMTTRRYPPLAAHCKVGLAGSVRSQDTSIMQRCPRTLFKTTST